MLIKRLILVIISLAIGFGLTTAILYTDYVGTTIAEYGGIYYVTTGLSFAVVAAIWLDKFMKTEILPK